MTRWLTAAMAGLCFVFFLTPLRAAENGAVQRAIDKGVAFLKSKQEQDGRWKHEEIGATSLAALTLLECGVPANDPGIQKAADVIRAASVDATRTYTISTAIMFLDLLGEPVDRTLIESLSIRLLAGQNGDGGWSYDCPALGQAEVTRLRQALTQQQERNPDKEPPKAGRERREFKDLPAEIQKQWNAVNAGGAGRPAAEVSDNSNTQFATFALWIGRRQGIPVEKALARVEARFRATQRPDGGWLYQNNTSSAPPNLPIGGPQGGGGGGSPPSVGLKSLS